MCVCAVSTLPVTRGLTQLVTTLVESKLSSFWPSDKTADGKSFSWSQTDLQYATTDHVIVSAKTFGKLEVPRRLQSANLKDLIQEKHTPRNIYFFQRAHSLLIDQNSVSLYRHPQLLPSCFQSSSLNYPKLW